MVEGIITKPSPKNSKKKNIKISERERKKNS